MLGPLPPTRCSLFPPFAEKGSVHCPLLKLNVEVCFPCSAGPRWPASAGPGCYFASRSLHASHGRPSRWMEVSTVVSLPVASLIQHLSFSFSQQACYTDSSSHRLLTSEELTFKKTNTHAACTKACADDGFVFAGVEAGTFLIHPSPSFPLSLIPLVFFVFRLPVLLWQRASCLYEVQSRSTGLERSM